MALLDTPQPDLSLEELRFLVTLAQTQSLTAAAGKHGLSMGSASRRLARLRGIFEDELFVRAGLQMLPTTRMRDMLPRILDLLTSSKGLFSNDTFEIASVKRTVRILGVDNAVMTILREAIVRFAKAAPNASLEVQPINSEMLELLRSGRADLAIYPLKNVPKDFHMLELYRSRCGILVREGHPLIALYTEKGRLAMEDLRAYRQVSMDFSGAPEFSTAASGATGQETAVSMPYFLAVPYALMDTDYTFIAPVLTLLHFLRDNRYGLRMLPAPAEVSPFTPCLVWHHGTHSDPFMQWVRGVVTQSARSEAKRLGALEAD
ncbi:LysR family transcriptional regulator [Sutterella sp.]|uniref:LysR family transcriptional regulator n=1 Tax=Sutterella sp. TaxID=1981025 RepID=UPI003FD839D0